MRAASTTLLGVEATAAVHLRAEELEAALDHIRSSPTERGTLELIVRRPVVDGREVLTLGELSIDEGLVGDSWKDRPYHRSPDGGPHPEMQLNVINARLSQLVGGGDPELMALSGDQLHVDLDLGFANLPAGTRLAIGDAVIEVTDEPHTGCKKFAARYGPDALRFVNVGAGHELRLRGLNAKVIVAGAIHAGDRVTKL